MAEQKTETKPGAAASLSKISDGMMDLFAATGLEDSSQGKFAANLQEIEASTILEGALWIRDRLNGVKE
ncbi:MAG: hypothetical protein PHE50_01825 [Dehalococcoidales bacterium]|nr:hypothetical protein [Dehalococcoidales bacterium]